jgi:hypothetical protein
MDDALAGTSITPAKNARRRAAKSREPSRGAPNQIFRPPAGWLPTAGIELPHPDPDLVRAEVCRWRFVALGNRSIDYVGRDLLMAALLRDRRNKRFRGLTRYPPRWMEERVEHLDHRHRQSAIELTTLDFLHRTQLGNIWYHTYEAREGPAERAWLRSGFSSDTLLTLAACRPYGAEMARADKKVRHCDFTCGLGQICPWCHGRSVVALYKKLGAGPCAPAPIAGKYLVRLWMRVNSTQLRHDSTFLELTARHRAEIERRGGPDSSETLMHPLEMRFCRKLCGGFLKKIALRWGVEGGVILHQVEPYLNPLLENAPEFRHEVNLIGTIGFRDQAHRDRMKGKLGIGPYAEPPIRKGFADGTVMPVGFQIGFSPGHKALRSMLAGEAYGWDPWVPAVEDNDVRHNGGYDVEGAGRYMPWILASPEQWWAYAGAARQTRLYLAFGTWQAALGEVRDRSAAAARNRRRVEPLGAGNEARRAAAVARREGLLGLAGPVFERLKTRYGRTPGRAALAQALAEEGHAITAWEAQSLAMVLKFGPSTGD